MRFSISTFILQKSSTFYSSSTSWISPVKGDCIKNARQVSLLIRTHAVESTLKVLN